MIHRLKTIEAKEIIATLTNLIINEVRCVCKNGEKKPESITLVLSNGKEFTVKPGFYGSGEYHITDDPKLVERFVVGSPTGAEIKISATFVDETKAKDFAKSQRDLGNTMTITKAQLPDEDDSTPVPALVPQDPIDIPF